MSPVLIVVVITLLVLVGGAAVLGRSASRGSVGPSRPVWANPAFWVAASVVLLLLGAFLVPRLLGFTFLLLPFIWMRAGSRRRGSRPQAPEE
jgi:hypothetical protein